MNRNPHSEFLRYHGFGEGIPSVQEQSEMELLRAEIAEVKNTMQQVLQELRKLNT